MAASGGSSGAAGAAGAPGGSGAPGAPGWEDGALRAALAGWAADEAVAGAAAGRRRERWLRQQAEAGATLAGALADLGEAGATVRVEVAGGAWTGVPVGVGPEVLVLQQPGLGAGPVVVRLAAVVAVAAVGAGQHAAAGDRPGDLQVDWASVLELLGADRSPARLHLRGGGTVDGVVWSVGADLVDVLVEGADRRHLLVALAAVEAVSPR